MPKPQGGLAILIKGKPAKDTEPAPDDTGYAEGSPEEEAAETPEEEAAEYPSFAIPEGLDLSDMEPGDEKEVLAMIRKDDEGNATITRIEGVDLAGGPPEALAEEALAGQEAPAAPSPQTGMPPAAIRSRAMGAGLM